MSDWCEDCRELKAGNAALLEVCTRFGALVGNLMRLVILTCETDDKLIRRIVQYEVEKSLAAFQGAQNEGDRDTSGKDEQH